MSLTPATTIPIHVGQVLAGKYRVESLLGDGGMGVVIGAINVHLRSRVALKLLNSEAEGDESIVSRFLREGKAAARLRSEHVARVLDCGTFEDGRPYLVTEWLEGADLATLIRAPGAIDIRRAVDLVRQTCAGLAEAHAAGIVHRDLKPANLFLTEVEGGGELVKILDFGVCKFVNDASTPPLTQQHEVLGTPRYMSPEQLTASRDIDARTDIWALGVILYELLTKRVPFEAKELAGLMSAVRNDIAPSADELRPSVSRELAAVIDRCLEKRREDRFASVDELARALAPHGERESANMPSVSEQHTPPSGGRPAARPAAQTLLLGPPVTAPIARPSTPMQLSGENEKQTAAVRRFGRYAMHGALASGGMAAIHYGSYIQDDGSVRPIAFKRIRAELTDPNFAAMLSDEARIASQVRHPNVVETLEVIVDGGEPMIALEYVSGVSLSLLLRSLHSSGVAVPLPIVAALAIDVLAGLQAAHDARNSNGEPLGIIHRDISPQNILIDESGVVKIADFGVAMALHRVQKSTEEGTMKGKLGYLAPEQIQGNPTQASDLYAVGVVLWEMLVGRQLFEGSAGEIIAAAIMRDARPPSQEGRADAAVLDVAVMTALARDPARRYASALEMSNAIASLVPRASAAEVAALLQASVKDELERRRLAVREVIAAAKATTKTSGPKRATAGWLATPLVVGAVVIILMLAVRFLRLQPQATRESPAPTTSALVAESSANVPAPDSDPAPEPASTALAAVPSAKAPPVFAAPKLRRPSSKPDCSTPYSINEEGRTIWKRECFRGK